MTILKNTSEHRCSCCRKQGGEAKSWKIYNLSDSSDTWDVHVLPLYFISVHHLRQNRVDAFWTPPTLSAAPRLAQLDAGSRFHSELCTALPPLPQHARSRGRPPAPPHAGGRKNVQNFVSQSVIGTRGRGGAAGKLVSGKERRWRLGAEL